MKNQLDEQMRIHNLDAIIISGPGDHNPAMIYMTGGGHFDGVVIKTAGKDPTLYCYPMEREEAARTGLKTVLHNNVKGGLKNLAPEYRWMLNDSGLHSGRVSFYGRVESGYFLTLLEEIKKIAPEFEFIGEGDESIMMRARSTKEVSEIERIRQMGKITTSVVGRVADRLSSSRVHGNHLLNTSGDPLKIGEVKSWINLWLAEAGLENPEGTIFSIGRDAAIPHSAGNPEDVIELGKTIVFDIFPCEAGGGYFYDFTRTWCMGHADEKTQQLYSDVKNVYDTIVSELENGQACKKYQTRTCDLFEEQGHPTIRSHPGTQEGYVHSLGHGLGLDVHEQPWFSTFMDTNDHLEPGSVFTIEPGLYYPERGMAVRLEDTYYVKPDGKIEILANYPMDLVLPVKK
jgi:Xaa-Pro aminopeptidase